MLRFYRSIADEAILTKYVQYRFFASVYTKTLNLPATKFPAFVKKAKRLEHDKNIREVWVGVEVMFREKILIDL